MKDIMEGISPLPFVVDSNGETIKIRLSCGAAICDMKFVTSIPTITKLPAAQNAAYIVKASNLYPELVEALDELAYEAGEFAKAVPPYSNSKPLANARAILAKCKAQEQGDE